MNLDTLSLYCDVIRSGSFSLGAANHRISQSAASQAVRQLEEEVGAQLIDRTKRPFMVTPEGRKFFEACLILLENFEKAKAEITSQRTLVSGVVRVAVIYSVGLHDMGFYTQQFTTRYPQAKIRLAYLHPHEVVEAVINHAITIQSGVSILPQPSVIREVESGILAAIPLDMPELVRPIGIIYRRQKLLTPTADKLLEFLQSQKH